MRKRIEPGEPRFVLAASALVAMLRDEPGGSLVGAKINRSVISTVTWTEVVRESSFAGIDVEEMREDLKRLGLGILPFTPEDADFAAQVWEQVEDVELSLADRACLALASRLGLPALTTDRAWRDLGVGVEIQVLG